MELKIWLKHYWFQLFLAIVILILIILTARTDIYQNARIKELERIVYGVI